MALRETGQSWNAGKTFLRLSREYLGGEYYPKIRRALAGLTEEDLWWRPNPASNSMGNLVLHLAGNVRQWVVAGIGGAPDTRDREEEFRKKGRETQESLLEVLEEALAEADEVLAGLTLSTLQEERVIQGMSVTVLGAVYHVVEHFSMHTGQIIYLSKLRTGRDLEFYRVRGGDVETNW